MVSTIENSIEFNCSHWLHVKNKLTLDVDKRQS